MLITFLGAGPVPIVVELNSSQCGLGFDQRGVDFHFADYCVLAFFRYLLGRASRLAFAGASLSVVATSVALAGLFWYLPFRASFPASNRPVRALSQILSWLNAILRKALTLIVDSADYSLALPYQALASLYAHVGNFRSA